MFILQAILESDKLEVKDNCYVRTKTNPEYWPIHDALSTDLHPEVPAFIPGKPFILPGIFGFNSLFFSAFLL